MMIWLNLALFITSAFASVVWIFPFPRWPPLDGINSRDHYYPCGINKNNKSDKYIFVLNRPYILRWKSLGNDTTGYKINLYNPVNESIQVYPSQGSDEKYFFNKAHSIVVSFKRECHDCFIQIEQFTSSGLIYFSCADIAIRDKEITMGNDNKKSCEKKFDGSYCQLKVDCHEDKDCLNDGRCVTAQNESISRICVCKNGIFGENCENVSVVSKYDVCFNKDGPQAANALYYISYGIFNDECYSQNILSPNDILYTRVIADQVEFIIDVDAGSEVTLGVRPTFFGTECKYWSNYYLANSIVNYTEIGQNYLTTTSACLDVIVASLTNDSHVKIKDGFLYGNHTPLSDTELGGKTSFSAAFGWKIAGRVVIMFRKPIKSSEPGLDHSFALQMVGVFEKRSQSALYDSTYHGSDNKVFFIIDLHISAIKASNYIWRIDVNIPLLKTLLLAVLLFY